MRSRIAGIIFTTCGIIMMIFTGFDYVSTEKVVDLGPIEVNKQKNHPVQWSPLFGVLLLAGGIIILVTTKNKSRNA